MHFIVKLFPEITIKSAPVRKRLTRQLRDNLRRLLKPINSGIVVQRDWEKVEVYTATANETLEKQVVDILGRTPGIANFSRVEVHPLGSFDDLLQQALACWGDQLAGKRFCVRVRRTGDQDFKSTDVERFLGAGLLRQTDAAGVDLTHPDLTLRLEIRQDRVFILHRTWPGLGGYPLGFQDPVLSLVSGGFDSTVASFLCMKRGLRTHFCFFNLGGRAHEIGVKEVAYYLWSRYGASHQVQFVTVPFQGVVSEILAKVDNAYMGVVLKRMMLRVATQVAQAMGVAALVTGESVGQVSSQTLPNLAVIDQAVDMLCLRPLIAMNKGDIINIARQIGTEEFAANMPEYCGVISVHPTTRAKLERVLQEEGGFDKRLLDQAVAQRREQRITEVIDSLESPVSVEIFAVPQPGAVILDIRHPDEAELKPLREAQAVGAAKILPLPFFSLQSHFAELPANRQYLLYCEKGVMSRLHAELLREAGHTNVAVYRPPASPVL